MPGRRKDAIPALLGHWSCKRAASRVIALRSVCEVGVWRKASYRFVFPECDSLTCHLSIETDRSFSFGARQPYRCASLRNCFARVQPVLVGPFSHQPALADSPIRSRQQIVSHFSLTPHPRKRVLLRNHYWRPGWIQMWRRGARFSSNEGPFM